MRLTRVTTRYIPLEDRILISADAEGGGVNLWLTLRLLRRLLPPLLDWVSREGVAEGAEQKCQDDTTSGDSMIRQLQRQWVAQHCQPVADVPAEAAGCTVLVRSLRLQSAGSRLQLSFVLPAGEDAVLSLSPDQARIWLDVLYRAWQQAGWPDIWPNWIKLAYSMQQPVPGPRVH